MVNACNTKKKSLKKDSQEDQLPLLTVMFSKNNI